MTLPHERASTSAQPPSFWLVVRGAIALECRSADLKNDRQIAFEIVKHDESPLHQASTEFNE